jgi:dUTP pyrophosphatase
MKNKPYNFPSFDDLRNDDEFEEMYEKIKQNLGINLQQLEKELEESQNGKITLEYVSKTGKNLFYNYDSDSGFDLFSSENVNIPAFGRALVPTGFFFKIPQDFEIQIRPKSGLAINEGLTVLNTPGTVDEGYTGEVKVIVFNTNPTDYQITKGMKIAQAVISRCVTGRWVILSKVDSINDGDRADNGFGSTGI